MYLSNINANLETDVFDADQAVRVDPGNLDGRQGFSDLEGRASLVPTPEKAR
jgi:hypothetical protein